MWPTHEDGIELYARYWLTRHGNLAVAMARAAAAAFAERADFAGEKAWNEVADVIGKLEKLRRLDGFAPHARQPARREAASGPAALGAHH